MQATTPLALIIQKELATQAGKASQKILEFGSTFIFTTKTIITLVQTTTT